MSQDFQAPIDPFGYAIIDPFGCAIIDPFSCAIIDPFGCAIIDPFGCAIIDPFGCAIIDPFGCAIIDIFGCAIIDPFGCAIIDPFGCAIGNTLQKVPPLSSKNNVKEQFRSFLLNLARSLFTILIFYLLSRNHPFFFYLFFISSLGIFL